MPTPVKSKYVAAVVHVACEVIGGCHLLAPGVLKNKCGVALRLKSLFKSRR